MNMMHLLHGSDRKASTRRRPRAFRPSLKPTLEGLEIRAVLSAPSALAPVHATTINMLPQLTNTVTLTGTTFNLATSLGGQTFNQTLTLSSSPNLADPTCPILHLQLGPIHLNDRCQHSHHRVGELDQRRPGRRDHDRGAGQRGRCLDAVGARLVARGV
jgi:hypothetical protein